MTNQKEIDSFNANRLPYEQIGEQGYYHGYEMGYQEASRGDIPQLKNKPQKRPKLSYIFPFFYSKERRKNEIVWSNDFWLGYCRGWEDVKNGEKKGNVTRLQGDQDGNLVPVKSFKD